MNSINDISWDSFIFGDIDFVTVELVEAAFMPAETPKKKTYVDILVAIGTIASTLALTATLFAATMSRSSSNASKPSFSREVRLKLEDRLKKARLSLTLSQQEVANLLNVSISTVQKVEQGDTVSPSPELAQEYEDLFELESFLTETVGKRRFAISSMLRSKLEGFGDMTALEFGAKVHPRGVRKILGILKRAYA